jgi:hypothetical protein
VIGFGRLGRLKADSSIFGPSSLSEFLYGNCHVGAQQGLGWLLTPMASTPVSHFPFEGSLVPGRLPGKANVSILIERLQCFPLETRPIIRRFPSRSSCGFHAEFEPGVKSLAIGVRGETVMARELAAKG